MTIRVAIGMSICVPIGVSIGVAIRMNIFLRPGSWDFGRVVLLKETSILLIGKRVLCQKHGIPYIFISDWTALSLESWYRNSSRRLFIIPAVVSALPPTIKNSDIPSKVMIATRIVFRIIQPQDNSLLRNFEPFIRNSQGLSNLRISLEIRNGFGRWQSFITL